MKTFTINDVERFSGIKAHTLRVWERRYALLHPSRSAGNSRLYTLKELERILNIALLKQNGYMIASLAKIHETEIDHKINILSNQYSKSQKAINDLTVKMYTLDAKAFEWFLDELLLSYSIELLIDKIIYPFLKLTNLLWTGNKFFEEHFVVTAIRKKLILGIENQKQPKGDVRVILFLPDTRQLDLGLLFSDYYLKKNGVQALYLGNDVTVQNLISVFSIHKPSYIFTYLPQNNHFMVSHLLAFLKLNAPETNLILGNCTFKRSLPLFKDNLIEMCYGEVLEFLTAKTT